MARVRVCIVSWNAKEDLRACLHSLKAACKNPADIETVVVDNASSDDSAAMVAADFPQVTLVKLNENTGFSGGNNVALEGLTAPYAFLLNSDAVVHPGTLDALLDFADATPDAGLIGPKVLNPDGSIQYSCRRWPTFAAGLYRNVWLGKIFPGNKPASDYLMQDFDHATVREVDWLSGCALLIRKECLQRIGPLDAATFFMYCEDMDWSLRAKNDGWQVLFFPGCTVTHKIGASSDSAAERMIWEHSKSMWRFYKKHADFFEERVPALARPLVPVGIWLRAVVRVTRRRLSPPKKDWRKK